MSRYNIMYLIHYNVQIYRAAKIVDGDTLDT
jgi:hypothetical protein